MITRYDVEGHDFYVEEHEYGTYVTYDDYKNLEIEIDDLKKKYQSLIDKITNIYMEY